MLLLLNAYGRRLRNIVVYTDLVSRKVHLLMSIKACQAILITFRLISVNQDGHDDHSVVDEVSPLQDYYVFRPAKGNDFNYDPYCESL